VGGEVDLMVLIGAVGCYPMGEKYVVKERLPELTPLHIHLENGNSNVC
jgi:hypothetical protein